MGSLVTAGARSTALSTSLPAHLPASLPAHLTASLPAHVPASLPAHLPALDPFSPDQTESAVNVALLLVALVAGVVVALALSVVIGAVVRRLARRHLTAADLIKRSRLPLRSVLVVVGLWLGLRAATDDSHWVRLVEHLLLIALILTMTWLVGSLAFVLEDAALVRYRTDVADNRHARRVRTQVQVLRRVTVVVLVICAAAGIALTFPSLRAFGASLLASAGVISIVAGLAAQSSLANIFAGMQLAFTDAIRVDDVVVVNTQWGRIEEITLTYVVVHAWDDRRLILPSTYFTTTPFENWTRRAADLLGTVELDVDWRVPVQQMRDELTRLLEDTDLWDRRVGILQVVDAVDGHVRVRALASAVDAPTLFDLRCYVREGLVDWAQRVAPQAMPRVRWEAQPVPDGADAESRAAGVEPRTPVDVVGPGEPAIGAAPPAPVPAAATAGAPATTRGPTPTAPSTSTTPTTIPPTVPPTASGADASTATLPAQVAWAADDTQAIRRIGSDSRLFTGSIEAMERSRNFQGPGQDAIDEREQHAEDERDGAHELKDEIERDGEREDAEPGTGGEADDRVDGHGNDTGEHERRTSDRDDRDDDGSRR